MLAAVGMPEGGIAQPARGSKVKMANVAAIAGERMSLAPSRMAFPLSSRAARRFQWFSEFARRMSASLESTRLKR